MAYTGYGTGDTLVPLNTSGVATPAAVGYQSIKAAANGYGLTALGEWNARRRCWQSGCKASWMEL